MLTTVAGVASTIALLLPGFTVAELAKSGRARASESDLELVLRALFYALLLHVAFAWWTRWLALRVGSVADWTDHVNALLAYVAGVVIGAPVLAGLALNTYLRRAEAREGPVSTFQRVLGGRDARDAWDYLFPQLVRRGAWLLVELETISSDRPRLVGGKFGKRSAVGQSPSEHNLYLQEVWTVSPAFPHNLVEPIRPARGIWITARDIRAVQALDPPAAKVES
ncbi:MAG: hypothetical protein QOE65_207 [Solirubrobacteraceae bacterium]|jgi:hypothetical protein|nr:hypothetical protein [Solirubrobacteraceae bacterium]